MRPSSVRGARRALFTAASAPSSRQLRIILMGPPGSGKGTISEMIQKEFSIRGFASGDMLRVEREEGSAEGLEADALIKEGALVPNEVMLRIVRKNLSTDANAMKHGWVLDGYPRSMEQAESLERLLEEIGQPLTGIIRLHVPSDVLIPRISGRLVHVGSGRVYNEFFRPPKRTMLDDVTGEPLIKRADDREEIVKKRLQTFGKETKPVIEYYQQTKPLITHIIECSSSPEGFEKIKPILASTLQRD